MQTNHDRSHQEEEEVGLIHRKNAKSSSLTNNNEYFIEENGKLEMIGNEKSSNVGLDIDIDSKEKPEKLTFQSNLKNATENLNDEKNTQIVVENNDQNDSLENDAIQNNFHENNFIETDNEQQQQNNVTVVDEQTQRIERERIADQRVRSFIKSYFKVIIIAEILLLVVLPGYFLQFFRTFLFTIALEVEAWEKLADILSKVGSGDLDALLRMFPYMRQPLAEFLREVLCAESLKTLVWVIFNKGSRVLWEML